MSEIKITHNRSRSGYQWQMNQNLENKINLERKWNHITTPTRERSGTIVKRNTQARLFEQILFIGPDPDLADQKNPVLLGSFPWVKTNLIEYSAIIGFSFPNKEDHQQQKNYIYDEFVFVSQYHSCNVFVLCLSIQSSKSHLPFFASPKTKNMQFSICLITTVPYFTTHFQFLHSLALISSNELKFNYRFHINDLNDLISSGVPIGNGLVIDGIYSTHPKIQIPPEVKSFISVYFNSKPDSPPLVLSQKNIISFPSESYQDSLANESLSVLFSIVSPQLILSILSFLHRDSQVIIHGKSLYEITMTVIAFKTLLFPFPFSGQIITVLPNDDLSLDILHSPTPFLIGVFTCQRVLDIQLANGAIIDLSNKTIKITAEDIEYPNYKEICKNFSSILKKEKKKTFSNIFSISLHGKFNISPSTIKKITEKIKQPLLDLTNELLYCFFVSDVSDERAITVFNNDLYLSTKLPQEQSFFKAFLETQTFLIFIDQKKEEYFKMKETEKSSEKPLHTDQRSPRPPSLPNLPNIPKYSSTVKPILKLYDSDDD